MSPQQAIAWTIAGSDSGGGAGIQADLHTLHDLGVHGCSVITALTAQNSVGVERIDSVSAEMLSAQLTALEKDLPAAAIKLGMQGDPTQIDILQAFLKTFTRPIVLDPVMVATSGAILLPQATQQRIIDQLIPLATIITPNLFEAECLLERRINSSADVQRAAQDLLDLGCQSVLLKGGHVRANSASDEPAYAEDYWTDGTQSFWLRSPRHSTVHTHGSGCTLSASLCATLAQGYDLPDALVLSKAYVSQGIRLARGLGQGPGPVAHAGWPAHHQDFPEVIDCQGAQELTAPRAPYAPSPPCSLPHEQTDTPLGLYPVVDSADWVERLLKLGVNTIQLRMKPEDHAPERIEAHIERSVALCERSAARLFINDHWRLALKQGAYGVHLGQSDLQTADIAAIKQAGLRLGISTHSPYEMAVAHAYRPSYLACGPIYATTSKEMPFHPQGLTTLARVMRTLSYPWVAIGGIGREQFAQVCATGVQGIAMISAITQADDPEQTVREFLKLFASRHTSPCDRT